jgi:hypothetical protein
MKKERLSDFLFREHEFHFIETICHDLGKSAYRLCSIFAEMEGGYLRTDQNPISETLDGRIHARRLDRVLRTIQMIEGEKRGIYAKTNFSPHACMTYHTELIQLLSMLSILFNSTPDFQSATLSGNEVLTRDTIGNILFWLASHNVNNKSILITCIGTRNVRGLSILFNLAKETKWVLQIPTIEAYLACEAAQVLGADLVISELPSTTLIELSL